jgi:hypothetical protein
MAAGLLGGWPPRDDVFPAIRVSVALVFVLTVRQSLK